MRIIQLTDLHMTSDGSLRHGVDVSLALTTVVEHLREGPAPDLIVLTGDLVHDDRSESYGILREILAPLDCPTIAIFGNHDVDALRDAFPIPLDAHRMAPTTTSSQHPFALSCAGWTLLFLDSRVNGSVGGDLDSAQIDWVRAILAATDQPAIAFVHHPPGPTTISWVDAHGVIGPDFATAIAASPGVLRRIYFGHVHAVVDLEVAGVIAQSCPSTSYLFGDEDYRAVAPVDGAPKLGYRIIDLGPEAQVHSRVGSAPSRIHA